MNAIVSNPLGVLAVGILIVVGGVIAIVGRLDRSGESGYFYDLLLMVVFAMGAVIVFGTASS
jgi:hypothetical protein